MKTLELFFNPKQLHLWELALKAFLESVCIHLTHEKGVSFLLSKEYFIILTSKMHSMNWMNEVSL